MKKIVILVVVSCLSMVVIASASSLPVAVRSLDGQTADIQISRPGDEDLGIGDYQERN